VITKAYACMTCIESADRLRNMTVRTYLVLIEDLDLALAVGGALEDRLSGDGHRALALVPTSSGHLSTLTGQLVGIGPKPAGSWPAGGRPHVVAIYEDGLLDWLESVGLPAYIGIPAGEEWQVIDWAHGAGAMLIPVACARDLVEDVARYTPWSRFAGAPLATAAQAYGVARSGGRPALYRKLAVAGVAGPMMLAGLPLATAAAASTSHLATRPSVQSPVSAVDTAFQASQGSPAGAGSGAPAATGSAPPAPSWFSRAGTAIQNYMAYMGQVEIDNAQANLAMSQQITSAIGSMWPSWPNAVVGGENGFAYGTLGGVVIGGIIGGGLGALAGPEAIIPGMIAGGYKGGEYGLIFGTAAGTAIGMINSHLNQQPATAPAQPGTESMAPGNPSTTGVANAADNANAQPGGTGTANPGTQGTGTNGTRGLSPGTGTTSTGGPTSNGSTSSSGAGNTSASGSGGTSGTSGTGTSGTSGTSGTPGTSGTSGTGGTSGTSGTSSGTGTSSGAGSTSNAGGTSGAGSTSNGAGTSGAGNTSAGTSTS
jgi:hypothetical protein